MDEKLPPFPYKGLNLRANASWFAICGAAGLGVVLGAAGYELAAELLFPVLCLGLGFVTLLRRDVFYRFYAASVSYWALPPSNPAYQKRLDGLERSRRLQGMIMPPFAILVGLGFLATAIESIAGVH